MSFPASPSNGEITVVNGIRYIYASATNSWKKATSSVGNLVVTETLTASNIVALANVTAGNVVTTLVTASGNITAGNVITTLVTASGNITAGNVITTLVTASGNVSAANVIATGNVQAAYVQGDGSKLTNLNAASTGKAIAMSIVFGG